MESTVGSLKAGAERRDGSASDVLFATLYTELHRLARRELAGCGSGATLGATTLLHEAYLEIAGRRGVSFPDRARFLVYIARVMRGLVIDYIRSRKALKRGGEFQITSLDTDTLTPPPDNRTLEQLNEALNRLAELDASLASVVDLKFFCGFSLAEIAGMRGLSERTVQRQWEKARIYLHRAIGIDAVGR